MIKIGPRQLARKLAGYCADAKSQTIVYATFVNAWIRASGSARKLLHVPADEEVAGFLNAIDLQRTFRKYIEDGRDPVIYFYEEFARAICPTESRQRGVHYSPPQIVSYVARGAGELLRKHLESNYEDATVVDPCCGTGAFLDWICVNLGLTRKIIGFEVSYSTSELAKLLLPNCEIRNDNFLEVEMPESVKEPLLIIGNPPYSGHSANPNAARDLMFDYRAGLSERNTKWLQDDYVKFIRVAQDWVERTGTGVVALITNHSYITNPTFRAMRDSLTRSFDHIYILDLRGDARRVGRRRGRDENVFSIQTGVAVTFLVRSKKQRHSSVHYAELSGTTREKLNALECLIVADTPWQKIEPVKPFYIFSPRIIHLTNEYESFPSVIELFEQRSVGFVTSRDEFAIAPTREAMVQRIERLLDTRLGTAAMVELGIGDLDVDRARRELLAMDDWRKAIVQVLYRPFDVRWCCYARSLLERPRLPFMLNMTHPNEAICVGRSGYATGSSEWDVIFCADKPVDLNLFRRGGATILPRFIWADGQKKSNIVHNELDHSLLFYYVCAVLNSHTYRSRYADHLMIDYPRIPIPDNEDLLMTAAELGRQIVDVQLMKVVRASPYTERELTIGGYELPRMIVNLRPDAIDRISVAISETHRLSAAIDALFDEHPPWHT